MVFSPSEYGTPSLRRENIGILWAKNPKYLPLNANIYSMFLALSNLVEMHSFLSSVPVEYNKMLINHGVVTRSKFRQFLLRSKFIIGIGQPLDGPTALEAISLGCVFINPVLDPPLTLSNKPNDRLYTSQHPFVREYIQKPYAFTIDITEVNVVVDTVRTILASNSYSYIHPSHTVHAYVKNLIQIFDNHVANCNTSHVPLAHPKNRMYQSYEDYNRVIEEQIGIENKARFKKILAEYEDDDDKKSPLNM